jgi:hypothetical protein
MNIVQKARQTPMYQKSATTERLSKSEEGVSVSNTTKHMHSMV